MATTKSSSMRSAVRKSNAASASPPRAYLRLKATLERDHFGAYVMINTDTAEYVVAPTTSDAHAAFIEKFGETAPGWCTRIGASVFATT